MCTGHVAAGMHLRNFVTAAQPARARAEQRRYQGAFQLGQIQGRSRRLPTRVSIRALSHESQGGALFFFLRTQVDPCGVARSAEMLNSPPTRNVCGPKATLSKHESNAGRTHATSCRNACSGARASTRFRKLLRVRVLVRASSCSFSIVYSYRAMPNMSTR